MAHPFSEHRQTAKEHSRVAHITKGYASGGAVHSDEAEDKGLVKKMVKKTALKMDGKKAKHRMDRPHRAKGGRVKKGGKTNVNVIVGQHPGMGAAPPMMPPPGAAAAPPMMPHPPMPPVGGPPGAPPIGAMPPGGAPGMPMPPPGMPHKNGGRAYAKGGAVKSGPGWIESEKNKTPVQHADGKDDGKDIGRGKVVTYKKGGRVGQTPTGSNPDADTGGGILKRATGGPIEAPAKMGPKLSGGAGGGEGRLEKAKRARKDYAAA